MKKSAPAGAGSCKQGTMKLIMVRFAIFLAAFSGWMLIALSAANESARAEDGAFSARQKQEIEDVVREYLRANPEVLVDAIQALQAKREVMERERVKASLASLRAELENDPSSPAAGNARGDVTVVEFFDYRCAFCKRALPVILDLLKADGKIRYVFREYPILGEDSKMAARAALAAWRLDRGKYMPFHAALMGSKGELDEARILDIAAKIGLKPARISTAMKDQGIEKILNRNYELALALGISGTPAFIIGDHLAPGLMSLEAMKKAVEEERKNKK